MSGQDRMPWWYSGDEDASSSTAQDPSDGSAAAAGDPGSAPPPPPRPGTGSEPPSGRPEGRAPTLDWLGLLSGAQRVVDWATETVLAPHAEHEDPREHPQCLVCRASVLLGEVSRATGRPGGPADAPSGEPAGSGVRWLPIRE